MYLRIKLDPVHLLTGLAAQVQQALESRFEEHAATGARVDYAVTTFTHSPMNEKPRYYLISVIGTEGLSLFCREEGLHAPTLPADTAVAV